MVEIDDLLRELFISYLRPPAPQAEHLNITMGQMECLHAISRLGEPAMSEVAKALRLHPSTVTVLVDGLVAHGLVERRRDPADRRVVRVAETAQGQADRKRHRAYMRSRVEQLLSELSDQELGQVHTSLRLLGDAARRRLEVEASS